VNTALSLRELSWDSAFFGRRIARIEGGPVTAGALRECLDEARGKSLDCLHLACAADDKEGLLAAGECAFDPVDFRLRYETTASALASRERPPNDGPVAVRDATREDEEALRHLVVGLHADTRFYYDRQIGGESADAFYQTWLSNSLQGFADGVLVAEDERGLTGYLTWKLEEGRCVIGLIGTAESARGRGIGRLLLTSLGERLPPGMTISALTQARNIPALRFYQRSGFQPCSAEFFFHKWLRVAAE